MVASFEKKGAAPRVESATLLIVVSSFLGRVVTSRRTPHRAECKVRLNVA
jgi:hypothetical protein